MICMISTNHGRGFRIRGTAIEAGPSPVYLCTGSVPSSLTGKAIKCSDADIAAVEHAVKMSAPINFERIDEAALNKDAGSELKNARARIAELERALAAAEKRIAELESAPSEDAAQADEKPSKTRKGK